jgi:FlhB-like protein
MTDRKKAAALKYPEGADAPFIAAKAKGDLAESLLRTARECGIPIVADENLADALVLAEIGDFIPPETYEALAAIFAFLKRME